MRGAVKLGKKWFAQNLAKFGNGFAGLTKVKGKNEGYEFISYPLFCVNVLKSISNVTKQNRKLY